MPQHLAGPRLLLGRGKGRLLFVAAVCVLGVGVLHWVAGRMRSSSESRTAAQGFHHVRIIETLLGRFEDDRHTVWVVFLEKEIPCADAGGILHPRGDSLEIAETYSHRAALHVAADIGEALGLPILDTGTRWA